MLIAIVAADRNWGIGKDDALLAHLPEDMRFFREHTTGHPVIMGRKTLESCPGGRPLKNRKNIVITRNPFYEVEGAVVVRTVDAAIEQAGVEDAFVIGGGSVYRQLIDYCDLAYVTKIDAEFEADTYFPNLDEDPRWELAEEGEPREHNGLTYRFTTYRALW